MKSLPKAWAISAFVGLGLILYLCAVAQAADFAGTWVFSGVMRGPGFEETIGPVCVFRQNGNEIQGSCKGSAGIGSADGAVDGYSIAFQWHRIGTSSNAYTSTLTFKGVWGRDGLIHGDWKDSAFPPEATGSFEAKKP
jgi:hypothetical protein